MKMEVLDLSNNEQRIILLFDSASVTPDDERVDEYLHAQELEPKKQYWETREDTDYLVYYFGRCYLDGHLAKLMGMAAEADVERLSRMGVAAQSQE